jgi:hypothetical protein
LLQLSLARNYFEGSTDVLANSSNLQTLLLASNYFGSDVVSLDGADILGKGVYQDPATEKLKEVGQIIQKNAVTACHPRALCYLDLCVHRRDRWLTTKQSLVRSLMQSDSSSPV